MHYPTQLHLQQDKASGQQACTLGELSPPTALGTPLPWGELSERLQLPTSNSSTHMNQPKSLPCIKAR